MIHIKQLKKTIANSTHNTMGHRKLMQSLKHLSASIEFLEQVINGGNDFENLLNLGEGYQTLNKTDKIQLLTRKICLTYKLQINPLANLRCFEVEWLLDPQSLAEKIIDRLCSIFLTDDGKNDHNNFLQMITVGNETPNPNIYHRYVVSVNKFSKSFNARNVMPDEFKRFKQYLEQKKMNLDNVEMLYIQSIEPDCAVIDPLDARNDRKGKGYSFRTNRQVANQFEKSLHDSLKDVPNKIPKRINKLGLDTNTLTQQSLQEGDIIFWDEKVILLYRTQESGDCISELYAPNCEHVKKPIDLREKYELLKRTAMTQEDKNLIDRISKWADLETKTAYDKIFERFSGSTERDVAGLGALFNSLPVDEGQENPNNSEFVIMPDDTVVILTTKMISEGEEVLVDYSSEEWNEKLKGFAPQLGNDQKPNETKSGSKRSRRPPASIMNIVGFKEGEVQDALMASLLLQKEQHKKEKRAQKELLLSNKKQLHEMVENPKEAARKNQQRLTLLYDERKGFYVKAAKNIPENTILGIYTGSVVSKKQLEEMLREYPEAEEYYLRINDRKYIVPNPAEFEPARKRSDPIDFLKLSVKSLNDMDVDGDAKERQEEKSKAMDVDDSDGQVVSSGDHSTTRMSVDEPSDEEMVNIEEDDKFNIEIQICGINYSIQFNFDKEEETIQLVKDELRKLSRSLESQNIEDSITEVETLMMTIKHEFTSGKSSQAHLSLLHMKYDECLNALKAKKLNDEFDNYLNDDIDTEDVMLDDIHLNLKQLLKKQRTDDVDDQDLKKQAGLKNLTNTCYANATFHELIRHPVYGTLRSEQAEQCKAPAVALAFIKLRDNRTTQALKELYSVCMQNCDYQFSRGQQEDMREFRTWLIAQLEIIGEDGDRYKVKIDSIFSSPDRLGDEKTKSGYEDFIECEIDRDEVNTVKNALDAFCSEIELQKRTEEQDGDGYTHKKMTFVNNPDSINIGLKRFKYDTTTIPFVKERINKAITIDQTLSINQSEYLLTSIVIHKPYLESGDSGHYYIYIKEGDHWYQYNDSTVTRIDEDVVLEDSKTNAYSVTYQRNEYLLMKNLQQLHGVESVEPSVPITEDVTTKITDGIEQLGILANHSTYDSTVGITYYILDEKTDKLNPSYEIVDSVNINLDQVKEDYDKLESNQKNIIKAFLEKYSKTLFCYQLDDVVQIVISQLKNKPMPYLLMNGCGTGKTYVIIAAAILLSRLEVPVYIYTHNNGSKKSFEDAYKYLKAKDLEFNKKVGITIETMNQLKKSKTQFSASAEKQNVCFFDEAHVDPELIKTIAECKNVSLVLASATLRPEKLDLAPLFKQTVKEPLKRGYSDIVIAMEMKKLAQDNNSMSGKKFKLELAKTERPTYLAEDTPLGGLTLSKDDLKNFHDVRDQLSVVSSNLKAFFGDNSHHGIIVMLLSRYEVAIKFKAVCERFKENYKKNKLTHVCVHLSEYNTDRKVGTLTQHINVTMEKYKNDNTKTALGQKMLAALTKIEQNTLKLLDFSNNSALLTTLTTKFGLKLDKNSVAFNPESWDKEVRFLVFTNTNCIGVSYDGPLNNHLTSNQELGERMSDDANKSDFSLLEMGIYDIDPANTMVARSQYPQRFVRAGTKATASEIKETLSLWKVFLYRHEHLHVKQEKGQASQDMLTGSTNHLATVHMEQAFKALKNDNFKELKKIMGRDDEKIFSFPDYNQLLMFIEENCSHVQRLNAIALIEQNIGDIDYSKVSRNNSTVVLNHSGTKIYQFTDYDDDQGSFIFLSHCDWIKSSAIISELFQTKELVVFVDKEHGDYMYGLIVDRSLLEKFKKLSPHNLTEIFSGNTTNLTLQSNSKKVRSSESTPTRTPKGKKSTFRRITTNKFCWNNHSEYAKSKLTEFLVDYRLGKPTVDQRLEALLTDKNMGYSGLLTSIPSYFFPESLSQYTHDYFRLYDLFILDNRKDLIELCEGYRDEQSCSLINLVTPTRIGSRFGGKTLLEMAGNTIFNKQSIYDYLSSKTNDDPAIVSSSEPPQTLSSESMTNNRKGSNDDSDDGNDDTVNSPSKLWDHLNNLQDTITDQLALWDTVDIDVELNEKEFIELLDLYKHFSYSQKPKMHNIIMNNMCQSADFINIVKLRNASPHFDPELVELFDDYIKKIIKCITRGNQVSFAGLTNLIKGKRRYFEGELCKEDMYMIDRLSTELSNHQKNSTNDDIVLSKFFSAIGDMPNNDMPNNRYDVFLLFELFKQLKDKLFDHSQDSILDKCKRYLRNMWQSSNMVSGNSLQMFYLEQMSEIERIKGFQKEAMEIEENDDLSQALKTNLTQDLCDLTFPFNYTDSSGDLQSCDDLGRFIEKLKPIETAVHSLRIDIHDMKEDDLKKMWQLLSRLSELKKLRLLGKSMMHRTQDGIIDSSEKTCGELTLKLPNNSTHIMFLSKLEVLDLSGVHTLECEKYIPEFTQKILVLPEKVIVTDSPFQAIKQISQKFFVELNSSNTWDLTGKGTCPFNRISNTGMIPYITTLSDLEMWHERNIAEPSQLYQFSKIRLEYEKKHDIKNKIITQEMIETIKKYFGKEWDEKKIITLLLKFPNIEALFNGKNPSTILSDKFYSNCEVVIQNGEMLKSDKGSKGSVELLTAMLGSIETLGINSFDIEEDSDSESESDSDSESESDSDSDAFNGTDFSPERAVVSTSNSATFIHNGWCLEINRDNISKHLFKLMRNHLPSCLPKEDSSFKMTMCYNQDFPDKSNNREVLEVTTQDEKMRYTNISGFLDAHFVGSSNAYFNNLTEYKEFRQKIFNIPCSKKTIISTPIKKLTLMEEVSIMINKKSTTLKYLEPILKDESTKKDEINKAFHLLIKNYMSGSILFRASNLFLKAGADVNARNDKGDTPLHTAIKRSCMGCSHLIKELLNKGADVTIKNLDGKTALELVSNKNRYYNEIKSYFALAKKKPLADTKSFSDLLEQVSSNTPLPKRSDTHQNQTKIIRKSDKEFKGLQNEEEVFDTLYSFFGNVRQEIPSREVNSNSKTLTEEEVYDTLYSFFGNDLPETNVRQEIPSGEVNSNSNTLTENRGDKNFVSEGEKEQNMLWAAECGHEGIMQKLLNDWVDKDAKYGEDRSTALHIAASGGYSCVVDKLILKGVDIDAKDKKGLTALHCAASKGHVDVVDKLIAAKANINAKSTNRKTALNCAAFKGHVDVVAALISAGVDLNAKDIKGLTALHWAAFKGHVDVVDKLIATGADMKAKDIKGATALHIAAYYGHAGVVAALIAARADVNAKGPYGKTALDFAIENDHLKVVDLLNLAESKGSSSSAVGDLLSTTTGKLKLRIPAATALVVDKLIAAKDATYGEDRSTALHIAASGGYSCVVDKLIAAGADMKAKDIKGATALHCAASKGHVDVVDKLIAAGVDLKAKDKKGLTALHCAASKGHVDVVDKLILKGVDIDAKDIKGATALHWAAYKGYVDVVAKLIAAGADVNAKGPYGKTALDFAIENDHLKVVNLLNSAKAEGSSSSAAGDLLSTITDKLKLRIPAATVLSKVSPMEVALNDALYVAAKDGNEKTVNELLEKKESSSQHADPIKKKHKKEVTVAPVSTSTGAVPNNFLLMPTPATELKNTQVQPLIMDQVPIKDIYSIKSSLPYSSFSEEEEDLTEEKANKADSLEHVAPLSSPAGSSSYSSSNAATIASSSSSSSNSIAVLQSNSLSVLGAATATSSSIITASSSNSSTTVVDTSIVEEAEGSPIKKIKLATTDKVSSKKQVLKINSRPPLKHRLLSTSDQSSSSTLAGTTVATVPPTAIASATTAADSSPTTAIASAITAAISSPTTIASATTAATSSPTTTAATSSSKFKRQRQRDSLDISPNVVLAKARKDKNLELYKFFELNEGSFEFLGIYIGKLNNGSICFHDDNSRLRVTEDNLEFNSECGRYKMKLLNEASLKDEKSELAINSRILQRIIKNETDIEFESMIEIDYLPKCIQDTLMEMFPEDEDAHTAKKRKTK